MKVEFWKDHQNKSPVLDFVLKQKNKKLEKKISKMLILVSKSSFINLIQSRFLKKLSGWKNIYEIAFRFNKIFYRFLVTVKNSKLIFLHAFKKKTNHTPINEIMIIKKRENNLN